MHRLIGFHRNPDKHSNRPDLVQFEWIRIPDEPAEFPNSAQYWLQIHGHRWYYTCKHIDRHRLAGNFQQSIDCLVAKEMENSNENSNASEA